jgi:hypothetical protein
MELECLIFFHLKLRNYEGIKTWATLGITESIKPTKVTKKKKNFVDKYLTSDFSRYGVGSKKAIFNIGSKVTVTSKQKNSRWVYEVSLSKVSFLNFKILEKT